MTQPATPSTSASPVTSVTAARGQPAGSAVPRRVAWITQGSETGGALQATFNLICAVQRLGWETPVIALQPGPLTDECQARNIPVNCLNLGATPTLVGSPIRKVFIFLDALRHQRRIAARLTAALRELHPDALHIMWSNLLVAAGLAARDLDIPCCWEIANAVGGNYPFQLNRRIMQWQAKRFGIMLLANSQYTATTFGQRPVKPIVFYLGADAQRFNPATVQPIPRHQLGIPEDALVFGIVARVVPQKGQREMIQALAALGAEGAKVHLALLGGNDDPLFEAQMRTLATDLNLGSRVHFFGLVRDPERYYGAIDVAVNSRLDPEPFGLSVIEAMIMGRPVLVHALGGPAETILDGTTGWHIHAATVDAFVAGLRRVLADRPRWPDMGQAARRHALAHFTTDMQAQRYAQILEARLARAVFN